MMLRTMRAIFNMPIKMTLLLLIYALTWHPHCPNSGHGCPASIWAVVAATTTTNTIAIPATVVPMPAMATDHRNEQQRFTEYSAGNHNVASNDVYAGSVSNDDGVNPEGLGARQDNDMVVAMDENESATERGIRKINKSWRSIQQAAAAIKRSHRAEKQRHSRRHHHHRRSQIINIYEKAIENGFKSIQSDGGGSTRTQPDADDGDIAAKAIYNEIYASNVTDTVTTDSEEGVEGGQKTSSSSIQSAAEAAALPPSMPTVRVRRQVRSEKKDAFDWLRESKSKNCYDHADADTDTDTDTNIDGMEKLIYDFVIKYKQMPRVTYFTCRYRRHFAHFAHFANRYSNDNDDDGCAADGRQTDTNQRGKCFAGKAKAFATLKRLFDLQQDSETIRTEGIIIDGEHFSASNDSTTSSDSIDNERRRRTTEIPSLQDDRTFVAELPTSPTVLIKVVQIDQLISKRTSWDSNKNSNSNNRKGYSKQESASERRGRPNFGQRGGGGGPGAAPSRWNGGDDAEYAGSGRGRNTYVNANWLEHSLASSLGVRQIVVLDLSCGQSSRQVLELASSKGLFNTTYHWLLIEREHEEPDLSVNKNNYSYVGNLTNRNNKNVEATVAFKSLKSGSPMPTPVDNDDTTFRVSIEIVLEQLDLNVDTEMTLAKLEYDKRQLGEHPTTGCFKNFWTLYDVWNPGQQYGGQMNISEIGNFTLDKGLQIELRYRHTATVRRRYDMKFAKIRCMIVVTNTNRTDSLMHYLTTHYDSHLDSMNRFSFALLSYVRDLYNFSFVMSRTTSWGYLKNGKFDGMIGALVRKQADIGGSPIFFRIERAKVIDYTARTWVARPCFIFRHPRSTTKDRIVFLQPFANTVWLSMAVCGIATIFLLWLLTALESVLETKLARSNGQKPMLGGRIGAKGGPSRAQQRYGQNQHDGSTMMSPCENTNESFRIRTQQRLGEVSLLAERIEISKSPATQSIDRLGMNAVDGSSSNNGEVPAAHYKIDWRHRLVRFGNIFCGQKGAATYTYATNRAGIFFETVLFYVGSICQQGLSFTTRFFSGRCIIITSVLFSFAIYQFYSASIVGTLLMEKPKTIRTLRDLVHSSLEIGIEDIVYNRDYFLRTKDPDAIELYAKKVTSVPIDSEQGYLEVPPDGLLPTKGGSNTPAQAVPPATGISSVAEQSNEAASKAKSYRDILHSHEIGAHAKASEASNWYTPEYGVSRIKKGRFAFHVDVATAYKIIADTFTEKEICDLTEIQLFPPQKMVNIVQKGSPLRKIMTYGLRRVTETGLMDYQRKLWHSQKPRCVKQLHTDDLRVDMQTFTSAFLLLLFGVAASLFVLALEIAHHKLWERVVVAPMPAVLQ